ncbi:MAG: prolyl oligopeptidase family serine peptidase [Bacteroidia bacterium]|nr:prolyl oligopeptidase family serine peptidase [Bacteroidia bacterium]
MHYLRLACGLLISLLPAVRAWSQQSRPLHVTDFDAWRSVTGQTLTQDGRRLAYELSPQKGDTRLYVRDLTTARADSFARGTAAAWAADGSWLAFSIKPYADSVRKGQLAKLKADKLPKDSLGIWLPDKARLIRVPLVKSFKVARDGGDWVAFLQDKTAVPKDTSTREKKKTPEYGPLVLMRPVDSAVYTFASVTDYALSDNGSLAGWITAMGDSIDSAAVWICSPGQGPARCLHRGPGKITQLAMDKSGTQIAFLYSADTTDAPVYTLWYWQAGDSTARQVLDETTSGMPAGWTVSAHYLPVFSENAQYLMLGTAPRPVLPPKDTLTEDEKVRLDVWHWQDARIQPHQLKQKESDLTYTWLARWEPGTSTFVQLGDTTVRQVRMLRKGNSPVFLGLDDQPYQQLVSWEAHSYRDVYVRDIRGSWEKILTKHPQDVDISPDGGYIVWYDSQDSAWYSWSRADRSRQCLTCGIPVAWYDEDHDTPSDPSPYGIAGFSADDRFVLIGDRYDLWKLDMKGQDRPVCLTQGTGRESRIRYQYIRLDRENPWVEPVLLLTGFHEVSRQMGVYRVRLDGKKTVQTLTVSAHTYNGFVRARKSDRLIWQRSDFYTCPDLWTGDTDFRSVTRLTDANPQQRDFRWGQVRLVSWKRPDGLPLEGLLYTPANMTPGQQYPMIVYYYELSSDGLNTYVTPRPSRSTVNASYYTSNGYVIFMPDIRYRTAQPGEDAYEAVMSGVDHLLRTYSFIDSTRMGLQGQSWGGYQTAYIVTRTDRFAAAMAGAPVSNMTSAYGGIRWGTGLSRMFQYEETQSRIGATLWEDPAAYLRNSPLFSVPQIGTPLLIMHNDQDGAVPWYQGIELFVAMRRLAKPAWMLTYNGEDHNLTRRANMVDLTIRMRQFFDHYLQGAPMPPWMSAGIPAVDKGTTLGY